MTYDYDLLVIGAGSGGLAASKRAASHGVKVAIVESGRLGGTCVNVGCVPKKILHAGALLGEALDDARSYGWAVPEGLPFDLSVVATRSANFIKRLNGLHGDFLEKASVDRIEGIAEFTGPHSVCVGERTITAERILIAVGSRPFVPEIPGVEHAITSDGFFELSTVPKRVVVAGAGYIALEFAGILNSFGSEVTVVHRNNTLLRGFDRDIVDELLAHMKSTGVRFELETELTQIEKGDDGLTLSMSTGTTLSADVLIMAIGRVGNVERLNLAAAGLEADRRGYLSVNAEEQTSVPSIYALGDVINKVNLTPVAIKAGRLLAERLYNGQSKTMSYDTIPSAVFTPLEIGTVGMTEEDALSTFGKGEVQVYRSRFTPLMHSVSDREVKIMMKMVVEKATDKVVGLHMVGPEAGEIIQGFAVAVKAGLTKADFDDTVALHPSTAEEFVTMA